MSKDLVKAEETALATVPEFDNEGMDALDNAETLVSLKVCQLTSPEKDEDSAYHVPGLKDGDLFITRLNQIVPSPIDFVVAHVEKCAEIKDGQGKVLETLPYNDPRGDYKRYPGGKTEADRTYYVYAILPSLGLGAVIKMSGTRRRAGENLELQFKLTKGISLGIYRLSVVKGTSKQTGAKYYDYRIQLVGRTKDNPELYAQAKALRAGVLAGKVQAEAEGVVEGSYADADDY